MIKNIQIWIPTSSQVDDRLVGARPGRSDPTRKHLGLVKTIFAGAIGMAMLASSSAEAQDWRLSEIGPGTKPALALALTPEGSAVIVYMLESQMGWVCVASIEDGAWRIEEITTGYFYGPPDIAIGSGGVVHATYHDHQAADFQPDKGDAVYLRRENGQWTAMAAADAGHDRWDNRITVDRDGRPHMAVVDPIEFDGDGVEYYSRNGDGSWAVEQLGTGPQTYKLPSRSPLTLTTRLGSATTTAARKISISPIENPTDGTSKPSTRLRRLVFLAKLSSTPMAAST